MNISHFVSGGIQTDHAPYNTSLGDYQYVPARDNDWHSVVMVYDGSVSRPNVFPLLQLYTDGRLQVGNARSDQGKCCSEESRVKYSRGIIMATRVVLAQA